jgi:hypothetical protein
MCNEIFLFYAWKPRILICLRVLDMFPPVFALWPYVDLIRCLRSYTKCPKSVAVMGISSESEGS